MLSSDEEDFLSKIIEDRTVIIAPYDEKIEQIAKEYEKLKEEMNGKPFKEYQRRKYEFYHRILDN